MHGGPTLVEGESGILATRVSGTAVINGVGFFDFHHGQRGVAPNAIELHPALGFSCSNCG